jgi:hypothetical protein
MKIHAHILSWNEEKILPYTLDYYSQICEKIFIYDNMSTDSSDEIYTKYPKVEVIKWDSGNEIHELNYTKIKSEEYKKRSRGQGVDWVIVCDCDEFLYHENLLGKLEEYKKDGIDVPLIDGHDMVSEEFPNYDGDLITSKIKNGSQTYEPMCKNIIFNPDLDVQYGIGGHSFQSINAKYSKERELKLLHYKFLGKDYVKKIYISRAKRLSQFNKQNKFGEHYFNLPFQYMDSMLKENYQVI